MSGSSSATSTSLRSGRSMPRSIAGLLVVPRRPVRRSTHRNVVPTPSSLDHDQPFVRLDDRLHDRQARAGSRGLTRRRRAEEAIDTFGTSSGGIPGRVLHDQRDPVALGRGAHQYRPAAGVNFTAFETRLSRPAEARVARDPGSRQQATKKLDSLPDATGAADRPTSARAA